MCRKWTKERVLSAIRSRPEPGAALRIMCCQDQRLYTAAYRLFGSWHDAVLAAGVEPQQHKWTKQTVLDAILARQTARLSLRGITRDDPPLYSATIRRFGSWYKALLAAGLPVKPRKHRTRECVLAAIQARYQQGLSLAGFGQEERWLGHAARRHFGGWRKAVLAAGIPDGWQHKWSRQRVIEALRACAQPGEPLTMRQVSAAVHSSAFYYFGTWHNALAAAGLVPLAPHPVPRTRWTRSVVLAEIRARWQQGAPLTVAANRKLAAAARKRFGRWHTALLAAGVPPKPQDIPSQQWVLDAIRALHARGALAEGDDYPDEALVSAARARFSSWHKALIAAGVRDVGAKVTHPMEWPAQRVIAAIQDRYVQGLPLIGYRDQQLAGAAFRRFGGWRAALLAAGIPGVKKIRPTRKWTPQRVIQEIQAWQASGRKLTSVRRTDSGLAAAARKYLGSWQEALRAAGLSTPGADP